MPGGECCAATRWFVRRGATKPFENQELTTPASRSFFRIYDGPTEISDAPAESKDGDLEDFEELDINDAKESGRK